MTIGVLALQGAFERHAQALARAGIASRQIRRTAELAQVEALIIPGGESTTIGKLMARYGLLEPIRELAASGRPLLGTCAGMILMAKTIEDGMPDQPNLGVIDITVQRNAFGRQVDSFECNLAFQGIEGGPARAVFIRAPIIKSVGPEVEVLARHDGQIVAARQGNCLVLSFHPELTDDRRIHRYFLSMR